MAFYDELQETATGLIREFGVSVQFITTSSSNAQTSRTAKMVYEGVEKNGSLNYGDQGVMIGDEKCLAESSAAPVKGDVVKDGATRYVVVFVAPIRPGGMTLAYQFWMRRA